MNITDTTTLSVHNLTSIPLTIEVTGLRPYTSYTISVAAFTDILGFPAEISVETLDGKTAMTRVVMVLVVGSDAGDRSPCQTSGATLG